MKFLTNVGAALLPFAAFASIATAIQFNADDESSIQAAAKQYSFDLMSLYTGNATGTAQQDIGIWPQPLYWWEGGAAWGGMIEYTMFTGDDSNVKTLQQALTANYGPANNFILDYRRSQTGNDDQAFWALAVMSALEYQFPAPEKASATYLEVAVNTFNNIMSRWDDSSCGGGLKWQIYPENAYGYNYKNSISAGTAFSLGARLARYTGNQTYADQAVKIYDWTKKVGLISDSFEVFDGSDDKTNCATVADKTQWSYNNAMFLHGSAFMFDYTKGDSTWKDRTSGFLKQAGLFFKPYENATNIMYEWACETGESGRKCNNDQLSFKAYLARFMAKTAILAPFTKDTITTYLSASASGAAKSCSGGADGTLCGTKWYTGGFEGPTGVGQQLSALEVTQALLMLKKGTVPAKQDSSYPETPKSSSSPVPVPVQSSSVVPIKSSVPAASSAQAPASSAAAQSSTVPTSAKPVTLTSTVPPAHYSSNPGGQFAETNSSSTSCTPSVTTTVYVNPPSSTSCTKSVTTTVYVNPPSLTPTPAISTTLVPVAPPVNATAPVNGTVPQPSQPLQFQGAASNVVTSTGSLIGALLVALVATML